MEAKRAHATTYLDWNRVVRLSVSRSLEIKSSSTESKILSSGCSEDNNGSEDVPSIVLELIALVSHS